MTQQELRLEREYLKGDVIRMMASDDIDEVREMYKYACERLLTIYNEKVDQIKGGQGNDEYI